MTDSMKTFKKAVALYIENCEANGMSKNTITQYSDTLRQYEQFCADEKDPMNPTTIILWKSDMRGRSNATQTISLRLGDLKRLFDFAVAMRIMSESPCNPNNMNVGKVNKKPYENVLEESEVAAIFSAEKPKGMWEKTWYRNRAILLTFLSSGARNSELRDLRPIDVNLETGIVYIHHGKGDKARITSISKLAIKAIQLYLRSGYRPNNQTDEDYLFGVIEKRYGNEWKQITREGLSEMVQRTVDALTGREGVRSHALRHACASILVDGGISKQDVQEILGHSDLSTTENYIKLLRPDMPAQSAKLVFDNIGR